jgi:nitroreductase
MPETIALEEKKHGVANAPVEDLILRRWSPRAFADKPVSDEDLKTIFTGGSWAASSYNEQPWRFLVGRKGDETWKKIFNSLVPMNQSWAESAPVLYASLAKKTFSHNGSPNRVAVHDVGAASATISLQATALGLHTHGMAGFDPELLRAYFGIPSDFEPVAVWALGYLGDPDRLPDNFKKSELQERTRKPLQELVFSEWGQAAEL